MNGVQQPNGDLDGVKLRQSQSEAASVNTSDMMNGETIP